jgi:hypothetical protein
VLLIVVKGYVKKEEDMATLFTGMNHTGRGTPDLGWTKRRRPLVHVTRGILQNILTPYNRKSQLILMQANPA